MLCVIYKYCPQNSSLTEFMAEHSQALTSYIRDYITGNKFVGVEESHAALIRPSLYTPSLEEHMPLTKESTVSSRIIDLAIEINGVNPETQTISHDLRLRLNNRFPELSQYSFYIRRSGYNIDHALHYIRDHYSRELL